MLEIEFEGAADAAPFLRNPRTGLRLPLLRLEGEAAERIFRPVRPAGAPDGVQLFTCDDLLIGCAVQPLAADMETAALELYRRLLRGTGGRALYRIWNYIPEINVWRNDLENYCAFSAGRARGFEEVYGTGYRQILPAASGVGCRGGYLGRRFLWRASRPRATSKILNRSRPMTIRANMVRSRRVFPARPSLGT